MQVVAKTLCFAFGSRRRAGEVFDTHEDISQYPFLEVVEEVEVTIEDKGEDNPPPVISLPIVQKSTYKCPDCDFETLHKVALSGHMRSHK
jgi:hypothetical protein